MRISDWSSDVCSSDLLLAALCGDAGDEPVFLDVPENNAAAIRLAEAAGLTPEFETARMYRGAAPAVDINGLYGITTFELGRSEERRVGKEWVRTCRSRW